MVYPRSWSQAWSRWQLNGLLFLTLSTWTRALDITYCSPDNDAGNNYLTSNYMSNGACQDNCQSSYAFAVIQGQSCWCSNYIPANQESTSQCSDSCPGFPYEKCGNTALGLYAYFSLGGTPSGTAGASTSPSPTSRTPSPSVSTSVPTNPGSISSTWPRLSRSSSVSSFSLDFPVSVLTNYESSQRSAESSTSSVRSSSVTLAPSSSRTSASSIDPTSVITSIISVTGQVSTILITPTAAPQATDSAIGATAQPSSSGGGGGLSGGTVAGIVVGVAIAIGLVIGGIVFLWLRRRHRRNLDAMSEGGSYTSPSHASKSNGGIPSRQVSQMSSAGLLTKPSRMNTGGISSAGDDARSGGVNSDRNSTHMTVDQRLNPWAIYSNEVSRASNVSLQDNQDYSRQLRVANPDP